MKKYIAIFIVLAFVGIFSSCTNETPNGPERTTEGPTEETTAFQWPAFAPEDIRLHPNLGILYYEDGTFNPTYRNCYYDFNFSRWLCKKDDDPKYSELFNIVEKKRYTDGKFNEPDEMTLVTFVKYCEITRKEFVAALESYKQFLLRQDAKNAPVGFDKLVFDYEMWELPNPDIIYTFDNEIINAYYRRENPIVPDEYKTYESYEEYLKAKP